MIYFMYIIDLLYCFIIIIFGKIHYFHIIFGIINCLILLLFLIYFTVLFYIQALPKRIKHLYSMCLMDTIYKHESVAKQFSG